MALSGGGFTDQRTKESRTDVLPNSNALTILDSFVQFKRTQSASRRKQKEIGEMMAVQLTQSLLVRGGMCESLGSPHILSRKAAEGRC